jgi:peptidoglycan/xylan/chitin deacetylase (PgdA/CDA1 family)
MTHANLMRMESEAVRRELIDSKNALEQRFGISVGSFAYPFGLYHPEQVGLVKQAGYSSAVTTREGIEIAGSWDALELQRIKISGKDNWLAFLLRMRGGRRGWR